MSTGRSHPGFVLDERAVAGAKEASAAIADEVAAPDALRNSQKIRENASRSLENEARIRWLERRLVEVEKETRALSTLTAVVSMTYTDYVDAANAVERDLRKAAMAQVQAGGEVLTFAANLAFLFVPVKVGKGGSAAKLFLSPIVSSIQSSLQDALVDALVHPKIAFKNRLKQEFRQVLAAIPGEVPTSAAASHHEILDSINSWRRELEQTTKEDWEEQIKGELARFETNVLAIGRKHWGKGSTVEMVQKHGVCEVHWIDMSGSGQPEQTFVAHVSFHHKASSPGPYGLWHWNYPFIRWVDPVYAPDAIARGNAFQQERYVQVLNQPAPILTLRPDQPLVTNRFIGEWSGWVDGDLTGKPLDEALGASIDDADREHELLYVEPPSVNSVYSKRAWNLRV